MTILLTSSILCLAGCASDTKTILVKPDLVLPERPHMLPVEWIHDSDSNSHCLTNDMAQNLLVNTSRLQAHIEVLEAYITASSSAME